MINVLILSLIIYMKVLKDISVTFMLCCVANYRLKIRSATWQLLKFSKEGENVF